MIATVIGYRNHSKRLINILIKQKNIKKICVYVYKKKISKYFFFKNKKVIFYFKDKRCFDISDIFFITSSTKSHFSYIKLLGKKNKYIFCEKPGVTNLKQLKKIKKNIFKKRKLYFNFNENFSEIKHQIKQDIKKKKFGKINNIDFTYSNGISGKKNMKNNWRFNSKNNLEKIVGNLGIHYIFFLISNFGKPTYSFKKNYSIIKKNDTAIIYLEFKKFYSTINLSYSSCVCDEITLKQTNNITKVFNGKYYRFNPAKKFNKSGYMIPPKEKFLKKFNILDDYSYSLKKSISHFINLCKNRKLIDQRFYKSYANTLEIILS